jgi:Flp pilus assembly protein TadB
MLTKTAPKTLDLSSTQEVARRAGDLASRKIWLPKLLYDCLPYFYLTAGFAAFFATLYISDWFWVLPHYILFSAACLHLSLAIYRRRKRARRRASDQSSRTSTD